MVGGGTAHQNCNSTVFSKEYGWGGGKADRTGILCQNGAAIEFALKSM
jgi:hypothetical protein